MSDSSIKPRGSFRSAGINNIIISAVVAVLSYFSLILVASTFGGSIGSDAYFFLFSLSTISSGLITCLYAAVLLPIFVDIKYNEGLSKAGEFAGSMLILSLIFTIPIALIAYVWYGQFFSTVSKFTTSQIDAVRFILIYYAPIFVITVISEFFRTLILASGYYTLAAFGAIFQPAILIASIYVFSDSLKEEALPLSLITSRFLLLIFMLTLTLRVTRLKIPLNLKSDVMVGRFFKVAAPYWSANVITSAATFYFDYMATGLGAGILTALAYSQRIYNLPITIVLNPIFEIARTRFCEARAADNSEHFASQHNKLMRSILYFTIPVSVLLFFFSHEIIASMFQRGAFSKENVLVSAECLRIYAFSLPFTAFFILNGRAVESFQKLAWPSFFGTLGQFISIFITFILVSRIGYLGIPISKVLIEICYFFPFGFITLRFFVGRLNMKNMGRTMATSLMASLGTVYLYFSSGLSNQLKGYFPSLWLLSVLIIGWFSSYSLLIVLLDRKIRSSVLDEVKMRL